MSAIQYTSDQKHAIEFFPSDPVKKHLVIEAGAGSGKTAILKERVNFLLSKKEFLPEDLVVITFTKNSTTELKNRIAQLQENHKIAEQLKFIHISTIDSFFASLVEILYPIWWDKTHVSNKIPSPLSLLDEQQAIVDLEQEFKNAMNLFSANDLCEMADFILAGGLEKGTTFQSNKSPLDAILSTMLSDLFLSTNLDYIRISAKNIHSATQKLIEISHQIARKSYLKRIEAGTFTYQDRNVFLKENLHYSCPLFFKELIVDEYQDTNHIQHEILWKLVELNNAQMTVVGDPKQSIYAFRGSNVDVFNSLLSDERWNVVSLDVNFRSTQTLLHEINTLSKLSFDWQSPNLPELFKGSFFYREAIKKSIEHKSLTSGLKNEMTFPDVQNATPERSSHVILFEYKSCDEAKSGKRDFNENNIKGLGQYLIAQKHSSAFKWKDVAVLCEKNKQIAKIKKIFTELGIPSSTDRQIDHANDQKFADFVALSLFNVLHDGIYDSIDFFYVLMSPLTNLTYDDVLSCFFYFTQNENHNSINQKISSEVHTIFLSILEIIKKYHDCFHHQSFIAWQNCRSELINLHTSDDPKQNAKFFSKQMDQFAQRILSISQTESTQSIKKILSQPHFNDTTSNSNYEHDDSDSISIKTVHGAKGLEWNVVCFYPAMSRSEQPETFSVSNSWPYLDINWLSEDVKSLSVLPNIENTKFNEIDSIYNAEKEKNMWFSDMRNGLEKNFERKRIFYTAFTRSRKKLIFVHPERQGASSAYKPDKKFNNSTHEKKFEQDIYLKYANLISETQTHAEHMRFSLLPETHCIHEIKNIGKDIQATSKNNTIVIENYLQDSELNEFSSIKDCFPIMSTPTSLIQQKQKRRHAAHRGVLFHVKSENNLFSEESVQHLIHSSALKVWTEFEIWNQQKESGSFYAERRVIDLLALFKKDTFQKILTHLSRSCVYFTSYILNESDYVFLIVDFKSGAVTNAGIQQISNYAVLVEKLCKSDWFYPFIKDGLTNVFIGLAK